jgi:hypothetical protein
LRPFSALSALPVAVPVELEHQASARVTTAQAAIHRGRNASIRRSRWNTRVPADQDGIFGKLPESRPGMRSPRRRSTGARTTPKKSSSPQKAPPARSVSATARTPAAARTPEPPPAPPAQDPGGGLEDLAWAGVAAAAEAATIGVRLASRAMEALRGSTEHR